MAKLNKWTPWGYADSEDVIGEGVVFYSTPGHGGIELSPERQKVVEQKFPNFKPFNGLTRWYEEDCDYCVVVAAFPELFKPESVERALKYIKRDFEYFKITL